MSIDRRRFFAMTAALASGAAGSALAQDYGQAFKVDNDDGRPIANSRLPGEIVGEIPALKGVTYVGPVEADHAVRVFRLQLPLLPEGCCGHGLTR